MGESVGEWAECLTCELIDSDRQEDLVEWSLVTLLESQQDMKFAEHELRDQIRSFHVLFFRKRVGSDATAA
ncbi:hypothetical protein QQ054_37820 [Oscillatoria amoena NRMC-F 0135]|nr:hypothetical protein [Oscillatoria amoena NRMC-F 0135]